MTPYYDDGTCVIYHGDALEMMSDLAAESCGILVTDPPYSSGTRQATDRKASGIPKRGEKWSRAGITWDTSFSAFGLSTYLNHLFRDARRVLRRAAHIYAFIDWRQYPLMVQTSEAAGLMQNNLIVWDKGVYALGTNWRSQHELIAFASNGPAEELAGHDIGNVLRCQRVSGGDHPTEKPLEIVAPLMRYGSAGIVLDPFEGSGTTLVAAKQMGRKAIGIEIEERYCEIAAKRLAQEVLDFGGVA